MMDAGKDERGIVSGTLNLSRNLGLVTGASVMGAVFALASGMIDITTVPADAVATGMRGTFALAAGLVLAALAVSTGSRASATRPSLRLIEDRAVEGTPIKVR